MVLPVFLVTGLAGLIGGLLVGLLGFFKNKLNEENIKWEWNKFLLTIGVYLISGLIVGIFSENIFAAIIAGLAVDKTLKLF